MMVTKHGFANTFLNILAKTYFWDVINRIFQDQLTVLAYHRVTNPGVPGFNTYLPNVSATPENFAWQMDYVISHFNVINLDQLIKWVEGEGVLPPRPLLITFDDGYADNYLIAYPELQKRNLPALIFVTTCFIDQQSPFYWDMIGYAFHLTKKGSISTSWTETLTWENPVNQTQIMRALVRGLKQLPEDIKNERVVEILDALDVQVPNDDLSSRPLTWAQVRQMGAGGVAVGNHTETHPILTRISLEEARHEILKGASRIEAELQLTVRAFAYPNGLQADFDLHHQQLLEDAGYQVAFSLLPGPMPLSETQKNPFAIRRILISHRDGPGRFAAKLSPLANLFRKRP